MIITVANQKGGQAKSTTAAAIATGLTYIGKKALAVDLDAQGNMTFSMNGNGKQYGAYELITGQQPIENTIQNLPQCDLIASSNALAASDVVFKGKERIYGLNALKRLQKAYDCIVIDTPPQVGTILYNALAVSDAVIVPLTADIYSLQGLASLTETVTNIKSKYNNNLRFAGAVVTRFDGRTILANDLLETIKGICLKLDIPMFNTIIRECIAVREAQTMRKSLFEYAPKCNPAQDYLTLIDELQI